ncbi:MAG: DUF4012 domain-containing protein [Candidatus Harrisonbacteria bacterium]|nr:DUF4012 domain-containing protein [Candidatus Harrisonbacteria bacterium]
MARRIFDIRPPVSKRKSAAKTRIPLEIPYIPVSRSEPIKKTNDLKVPAFATLTVFLLVLGIFGFNIVRFERKAVSLAPGVYENFKEGAKALLEFDFEKAQNSFENVAGELGDLNSQSPLKTVPAVLANLFKISENALGISEELENLRNNAIALSVNKRGTELIASVKKVGDKISEISSLSEKLKKQAISIGYTLDEEFFDFSNRLVRIEKALGALIGWMEEPKKQRLLVLFQNPSEIRPGGGFIGSYAMITFFRGSLLDINVRDIYDPDGQLEAKIIPPKQLQGTTGRWGARDSNWFFDFPQSAKKAISLLEESKIYSEQEIKFSGAIGLNVRVIEDLLETLGPIELLEYDLTIDSDNFLAEVQREVETGEDKAEGEPKRILKVLAPIIFDKLSKLNESDKKILSEKLGKLIEAKDIMVYFDDSAVNDLLSDLGVSGAVAKLSDDFIGEYLAIVNANIAGGKSDAFMKQSVKFESKIDGRGFVKNKVSITRTHNGADEKDQWYRKTNQDFMQIYVTPGSELEKITGATKKIVYPIIDYSEVNYRIDPDLENIETSELVFGKSVFSSWLSVKAGETKTLQVDYLGARPINLAAEQPYQFIFEKQSGVESALEIILEAPEGHIWKESKSRVFGYSTETLPARLTLNLTLLADQPSL